MGILDSIRSPIAFPGPELILHKRHAPDPVTRDCVRHSRLLRLRPINPLHARLVRQKEKPRLRHCLGKLYTQSAPPLSKKTQY